MRIHVERLLAEFVDRETEMARYREMLDDRGVCVFAVWGGGILEWDEVSHHHTQSIVL